MAGERRPSSKERSLTPSGLSGYTFAPPLVPQAFEWARLHGLRLIISLHAAPGSQNGWEHSASRDGIPLWGRRGTNFIAETYRIVEALLTK